MGAASHQRHPERTEAKREEAWEALGPRAHDQVLEVSGTGPASHQQRTIEWVSREDSGVTGLGGTPIKATVHCL